LALGTMFQRVFGLSIGFGLLTALDTLSSQAYGAGETKQAGRWLQRAIAILFVFFIPVFFLNFF